MIILTANSAVAILWFPKSQFILAASIASASNFVGMGVSFIAMTNGVGIMAFMWVQAVLSSVFFLFNVLVVKPDPGEKPEFNFKKELLMALKDRNMMFIVCCTASVLAVNYAFTSTIGILLEQVGYGVKETGWVGFVFTMTGLAGAILATYLAEVRRSTKVSLVVFVIGSILFSIVFSAVLSFEYANYTIVGLFGASVTGSLPLGIIASVEYMKQVHDSVPTNLIYLIGQVISCVYTYPIQYFYEICGISGVWVCAVLIFLSYAPLLWFTRKVNGENFERKSFVDEKMLVSLHEGIN